MKKLTLAAGLVLMLVGAGANASLVGDTVDASMWRTVDNGQGTGRILGEGLDSTFVVTSDASDTKTYGDKFTLNVDAGQFTIQFLDIGGWLDGTVFRLTDLDFGGASGSYLAGLTVDTNIDGYTFNWGSDWVEIGLSNTDFTDSTYFTGTFNVSAPPAPATVPEPSSLCLASLAALGLGLSRRKMLGN